MHGNLKLKSLAMLFAIIAGLMPPMVTPSPAEAQQRVSQGTRDAARGRVQSGQAARAHGVHRGNRGHVNRGHVNRGRHHVNRPVHRGPSHVRHHSRSSVVVVHPRRTWNPGGAIAAGAALGFIAGAAASSWAGPPPRSGYCWFYTNPQRTTGFWDICPRR